MRDDKGKQEGLAKCFLINFQFSIWLSLYQPFRQPYGCRLGRCFCFAAVSNGHPHPYTGEAEVCSKLSSALNGEIKFTVLLGAKHRVAVFNA